MPTYLASSLGGWDLLPGLQSLCFPVMAFTLCCNLPTSPFRLSFISEEKVTKRDLPMKVFNCGDLPCPVSSPCSPSPRLASTQASASQSPQPILIAPGQQLLGLVCEDSTVCLHHTGQCGYDACLQQPFHPQVYEVLLVLEGTNE